MLRRAALPALCLVVAGCGLVGPPATGPYGLSSYDGDLRRLSAGNQWEAARRLSEEKAGDAGDELLANLNRAIVAHYAGEYETSNELLEAADLTIEERFTKSVSRAALSLVTSDRSLAWLPSPSERLMIHVYGARNYMALDRADEAAVEARRLSRLLDEMVDENGVEGFSADTRRLYRTLRYFTAAVFEQARETNDADVAYRLAGVDREAGSDAGVVILVESGFVAHRSEQSVNLLIGLDELDDLRYGTEDDRRRNARCFSHRRFPGSMDSWGVDADESCGRQSRRRYRGDDRKRKDDDVTYLMRVAWPTMVQAPAARALGPSLAFTGGSPPPFVLAAARDATALDAALPEELPSLPNTEADTSATTPAVPTAEPVLSAHLSGAVTDEFNREAPAILLKAVARAAVKYAVVQAIEDGAREEDDTLGDIAAVVGNLFTALTERADTRSWALLPAGLEIVRLDLPPGTHDVAVATGGGRTLDLGAVDVYPGRVAVLSARAWP